MSVSFALVDVDVCVLCGVGGFICSRGFCLFLTGMAKLLESALKGEDELSNLDKEAEELVKVLLSSRKTPNTRSKKQKLQHK